MISRNTIKDAIINALQPLHIINGGTVKDIGEYNQDILNDLSKLMARCPALYVSYAGSSGNRVNQSIVRSYIFSVFVLYKSLRSTEATERGAIVLLESVENIMENNMLGLNIEPMEPAGDTFQTENAGITMYALNYATGQQYIKEYR